jgi:hypothetical protein
MAAFVSHTEIWPGICADLRRILRALLARALPAPLAARQALLTWAELRAARAWLKPLERMARLLVVAAALALPALPFKPVRWSIGLGGNGGGGGRRSGGPVLGFRIFGGEPCPTPGRPAAPRDPAALFPVEPLIARFEAVCGVIADPVPHVVKMARSLRRDARRVSRGSGGPDGANEPYDLGEVILRAALLAQPSRARFDTS